MTRQIQGNLDGSGLHLGLAAALWNQSITDRLLDAAVARASELGVEEMTIVRVPGALELPVTALQLVNSGCHGVVAMGVVIRGETDHYELVAAESARGLGQVSLDTGVPIANSILAVHEVDQAVERSGTGPDNKGVEGVEAVISTIRALGELDDAR